MNTEQFRCIFNATDHLLKVTLADGSVTMAVGLNGEKVVLHNKMEIPVERLHDTLVDGLLEFVS